MKKNQDMPATAAELRRQAEERLRSQPAESRGLPPDVEMQRLLHELQVHQIELEMQNEELRDSRTKLETALARYTDLYDFAPDGYLTFGPTGAITQANLAALRLLGLERGELTGRRLGVFVCAADLHAFNAFIAFVFAADAKQTCEVTIEPKDQPKRIVRINATLSPNKQECRAVLLDITESKESEAELQASRDRLASLSRQLIAVQESERRHLARELHDEIGQALCAVSISLKMMRSHLEPAPPLEFDDSIGIVDQAIQKVREMSLDLRPAVLDAFGLEAALRWYAVRFSQRACLPAHFTAHVTRLDLPEMVRNACFRLTQETLTNVVRHGKARQVWIDLQQQGQELTLSIRDDGQGFNVALAHERAVRGDSLGLIIMQERVELLGGSLTVESQPGAGTVVRVHFPWPALEDQAPIDPESAIP